MIFISHTHTDKARIEPLVHALVEVYGQENIFYDSWSIRPGDSIIGKMEEGLKNCKFFFFFISEQSLKSGMVGLEWQNALIQKAKGHIKFIPVKLDNCDVPFLLTDSLYIDCQRYDIETVKRQMIDVISGEQSGVIQKKFQNLAVQITSGDNFRLDFTITAKCYLEPISSFCLLVENDTSTVELLLGGFCNISQHNRVEFNNRPVNAVLFNANKNIAVGFPLRFSVATSNKVPLKLIAIGHEVQEGNFEILPIEFN